MTLAEIRTALTKYGYGLQRNVLCPITMKKKWKYGTYPLSSGGGHGHFDSKAQLEKYLAELDFVRNITE